MILKSRRINRDIIIIKILFFILVVVSLFTVDITTRTKYVSYLNTYSAATAGEFYFGSNYLGSEQEDIRYTISSWDKRRYNITLQMRSYENSLLYNKSGVDFYYKVDAVMYTDEACTVESEVFTPTITYGTGVETITINDETYAYFQGRDVFDSNDCKQNVTVSMEGTALATTTMYMKITAQTYPLLPQQVVGDTLEEGVTDGTTGTDGTGGTDEVVEIHPHTAGVFDSYLEATFVLQNTTGEAIVKSTLKQNAENSEVQLVITCSEIIGATTQKLRVYFDNTLLEGDTMTLPGAKAWEENPGYSYVEINVNSLSVTTALLLKKEMSDIKLATNISEIENGTAHVYVQEIR